jgi:hypothetical protein
MEERTLLSNVSWTGNAHDNNWDTPGSEKTRTAMLPSAAAVSAEWIMMVIFKDTRTRGNICCGRQSFLGSPGKGVDLDRAGWDFRAGRV